MDGKRDDAVAATVCSLGKRLSDHFPTITVQPGLEAYQFGFESPRIRVRPEFASYALELFTPGRPMRDGLLDLTARIHKDFRFDSKVTNVRTPTERSFESAGACARTSHILQIACLRSLNIAARYVSGYLRTYPPPGQPRLGCRCIPRLGVRLLSRNRMA